jgi:hypothetical protein
MSTKNNVCRVTSYKNEDLNYTAAEALKYRIQYFVFQNAMTFVENNRRCLVTNGSYIYPSKQFTAHQYVPDLWSQVTVWMSEQRLPSELCEEKNPAEKYRAVTNKVYDAGHSFSLSQDSLSCLETAVSGCASTYTHYLV